MRLWNLTLSPGLLLVQQIKFTFHRHSLGVVKTVIIIGHKSSIYRGIRFVNSAVTFSLLLSTTSITFLFKI